ncbi:DUF4893 domain-containing protein [Stakelama saccharophila]|uniref:DUF4893 domain-containing protein n=1 Tax=Stakelama saccharophila TaxID=3075605 RepID=A0ABZ0BAV0_9SPHN|nr:DUF4893 domain-containing protein [Stakelama sp. W311]WNO54402.1 DUF4893 domain-containing protein [Stakelama sp. W311]
MPKSSLVAALSALALTGCSHADDGGPAAIAARAPLQWRSMATPHDRDRLRDWRKAWKTALPRARAFAPERTAAEGALFNADLALPGATPPIGEYRCRTFKLGAAGPAMLDFIAYPWFRCRVTDEGEALGFYKVSGSQRPVGLILRDSPTRAVFLGTLVLGDEQAALQYGADPNRDMAGFIKRVGDRRWRLALPYPHYESLLDVIELVPADSARETP